MKADKTKINRYLNVSKGQIEGIQRMVDNNQYCLDISNQILATIALLKKANHEILSAHLKACVNHASSDENEEKIEEIITLLKRIE